MLITLLCALTFPIGVPLAMASFEARGAQVAVALAVVFAVLWLISAGVSWRAGGRGGVGFVTGRALVGTIALVGLGAAGAWARSAFDNDAPDGFETDELGVLLLGFAVLTFVVVALLLSSVRAGAARIRAR